MTKVLVAKLRTADSHIKNGEHRKALNILDNIIIEDNDDIAGDYYISISKCHLHLGNLDHNYPDKAISFFKRTAEHDNYGLAKYLKGWQLQLLGQNIDAKETFNEAYSSSLRSDNSKLTSRILNRLSYVLYKTGSIDSAIKNLEKCVSIQKTLENYKQATKIKNNIARICLSTGRLNYTIETLENNIIDIDKKNDTYLNAILSLSLSYALQGDRQKALNLILSKGKEFSESQHQQFIYHEYHGQILMLDGQFEESLSQLHTGLELALKNAPESDMISQIERLLGDAYLLAGDYKKSELHTKKSLQVAEKLNERVEIGACYRVFAQLEYRKGNNDKAQEWFKKSIDMFRLINSNYELAVTRYLASTTTLYVNGEKSSMLYLAKEYFESENISHYVLKIQKVLQNNKNGTAKIVSPTSSRFQCPDVITVNKEMIKILDHTKNIASSEMSILLTGETGTGKEIMARYIHYHSGRNDNFVAVNSSAFPNEMFESELFGYKKGAFTGAKDDKPGLFEMAEGGTFFLDEIGDINLDSQAKLLRVLDQKLYRRLGENKERKLNFRLISATNRNLEQMIKDNLFRPDLYFRLKEIEIKLPPLRERKNDILSLVEHFLQQFGFQTNGDAKLIEKLCLILTKHEWSGNVRELRSEIRKLILVSNNDISMMIKSFENSHDTHGVQKTILKHDQLLKLLEKTDWNQSLVARKLNISEGSIRYWMKKHNISKVNS